MSINKAIGAWKDLIRGWNPGGAQTIVRMLPGALLILAASIQLGGTTLPFKTFDDLVAESDGIVAGRVAGIESHYSPDREIYTFVTFDQLDVLGGSYQGSALTLRLSGGQVGNDILRVVGSPRFELNERVVLFVHGNGRYMAPLVGWTQGVFRIVRDPATGREVVHDHEGNRLIRVQAGQVIKEEVVQPEADIAGRTQGLGRAGARSQGGAGSSENGAPAAPAAEQSALTGAPAMTSQAFLSAIRRSASLKAAQTQLNSVSLMDFSVPSNNADAAAGPRPAPSQVPASEAPVPPGRSPVPQAGNEF